VRDHLRQRQNAATFVSVRSALPEISKAKIRVGQLTPTDWVLGSIAGAAELLRRVPEIPLEIVTALLDNYTRHRRSSAQQGNSMRIVILLLLSLSVAACQTVRSDVTVFHDLPDAAPRTFSIASAQEQSLEAKQRFSI
jgi:hypothetical protein